MSNARSADLPLGRRGALAALAGVATAATFRGSIAQAQNSISSEALVGGSQGLQRFGKIISGYGKPVIGGFHGTMFVRVGDKKPVPVFGWAGTGISQARLDRSGKLFFKSRETNFFTDLKTGDVLENWDNPFTGERVPVYHFYNDLLNIEIPPADVSSLLFQSFGADQTMMSWDFLSDKKNLVTKEGWPSYSTGDRITPSEHFTLYLSTADLLNPDVSSVQNYGSFARVAQCWPFMKMGGSPYRNSLVYGRMFTHKAMKGFDDVPPKVLAYLERHAPRYLELPTEWHAPRPSELKRVDTWNAFAQDVPPETKGYAWSPQPMERGLAPPTGLGARFRLL